MVFPTNAPEGQRLAFTSTILPPYLRRAKSIEELLPWLYLKGISTGDFSEALAALLKAAALGLSASTITRLKADWWDDYERCSKRDLSARRYVYIKIVSVIVSVIDQPVAFDQLHHPRLMLGAPELQDARRPQPDRHLRLALAVPLEQELEDQLAQPPGSAERHRRAAEVPQRIPAEIPRPERACDARIAVLARHHQVGRSLDDLDAVDLRIIGRIEGKAGPGQFHRAQGVEILRIVAVEEAGLLEDDRCKEFRNLGLMRFADPGQPQPAGVFGIAQHGMGNLPHADDFSCWPSTTGMVDTIEP